jgi:enoyl-CoA hydratase
MRADRRSARDSHGLPEREALMQEWDGGRSVVAAEGISGARRFAAGAGRSGDFGDSAS